MQNVIQLPSIGDPIIEADQGIYYSLNLLTGNINNLYRLDYAGAWYLHQLSHVKHDHTFAWANLADHANDTLFPMTPQAIRQHHQLLTCFLPNSYWRILRNQHFGFAKITAKHKHQAIQFAVIPFENNQMQMPLLVTKADAAELQWAEQIFGKQLQFA